MLKWVGVGGICGILIGLSASLFLRPPIVDDRRLSVPTIQGEVLASFVGGSLTDGRGATLPTNSFVALTAARLAEATIADVEAPLLPTVESVLSALDLPLGAGLVVLELGNTDYYVEQTATAELERAYGALIAGIRETNPQAALVCLGLWGKEADVAEYDAVIRRECRSEDGEFLRLSDIFQASGMRNAPDADKPDVDTFHPNDAGHLVISDRILASLRVI